jgi:20S proteasome alpha/beta subunit
MLVIRCPLRLSFPHSKARPEAQVSAPGAAAGILVRDYIVDKCRILKRMPMNFLQKPPPRRPVTIIVGIIARGDIVLASDSQTTAGTTKRTDTSKMALITFGDSKEAVVAQSGDYAFGSRVVETLEKLALSSELRDYRAPADLLQEAIRLAKEELTHINNWEHNRELEREYLQNNPASFLIAYHFGKNPYLYVADSVPGFARPERTFACVGCGGTVAEFILSRLEPDTLDFAGAAAAAIYAVEEVKKVDAACGGPTKAAWLRRVEGTMIFDRGKLIKMVGLVAKAISTHDNELKDGWKKAMGGVFGEVAKQMKREMGSSNPSAGTGA